MRALVQRVTRASVTVDAERMAEIGPGLLVLLGVRLGDEAAQADRLADKVRALRVFDDADGRMNEPLGDRETLCVSQFTLYGDARKGRRPTWNAAAPGPVAEPVVESVVAALRNKGVQVETGTFGADMAVSLVNDGPVTLVLESP
jgi:D-aminoacyl-tRNA deacylase